MRGEHFLLLAEKQQLLAPVVLAQLRGILAQQQRPATGEAIARLLVDRRYLTVEQARRLVEAGTARVSPLVPQQAIIAPPAPSNSAVVPASHQSDELLLAPEEPSSETLAWRATTTLAALKPAAPDAEPAPQPVVPSPAALAELTDSLRQWMELPVTIDWNAPPSPLFAPPKWKVTQSMVLLGVGGVLVLFAVVFLMALTRWMAG